MSKRLDKLCALIPRCGVLADVGCDHGYVGLQALRSRADRVVFTDISAASLAKARCNCPAELQSRAAFLCMDGLRRVQADCAVIAGMGGLEIIRILSGAEFPPQTLVLQPNRNARSVREYLCKEYRIALDEKLLEGGKFYDHILAHRGGPQALSELQLEFGLTNLQQPKPDFRLFLQQEEAKLTKILSDCNDPSVLSRLNLVRQAIAVVGGQQ